MIEKKNLNNLVQKLQDIANTILKPKLGITVDRRDNEIIVNIFIDEEFYTYIIITWGNDIYHIEAMIGDENAVIQPQYFTKIREVATFLEKVYELCKEYGII